MVGFVYQPHYMTACFRVAADDCQDDVNYIIICDDRSSYYGVWKWYKSEVELTDKDVWYNGSRKCYCIPINKCVQIQTTLTKPFYIDKALEVCNRVRGVEKKDS